MAQITVCPRCALELFVPESMEKAGGASCPECGGFIELSTATLRELPSVSPSTVDLEPVHKAAPTVSDFPSLATWSGTADDEQEPYQENDLQDEVASLDETDAVDAPVSKSVDEAAQRIDAWFKSAKTLTDLPTTGPGHTETPEPYVDHIAEATSIDSDSDFAATDDAAETNATIDLGASGLGGLERDVDFELEPALDQDQETATWDDSQHMDRLLAGVENQPAAEFTPFLAQSPKAESSADDSTSSVEWSTSSLPEKLKLGNGATRRQRSLVRTLAMTVISGAAGLAMGYYALLWMRGPSVDFLSIAHYIPKAILPASFSSPAKTIMASNPAPTAPNAAATDSLASDPVNNETPAETPKESGEIQASYNEPAEPSSEPATTTDQQAATTAEPATTTASDPVTVDNAASEPADLGAQPGGPLAEIAPLGEMPKITGAPTFTPTDLTAALKAATDAQPGLVTGNLSDGKEVARTKGMSYSTLADLAQKLTFVDTSAASADIVTTQQQAEELFSRTLADEHTRSEVAQITPMWIAAPKRQQGGVFFAGHLSGQNAKGSVVESEVDLGTGKSLTVLMPPALAQGIGDAPGPTVMVGWIVDHPAEQVEGYKGAAPQAIFVNRLIPLQ